MPFAGETIIEHVLSNIPLDMLSRCVLVTGSDKIESFAKKMNIETSQNKKPELGIGRTIKIGLEKLGSEFDGYMFAVCDQPLLTSTSIAGLIDFWKKEPDKIAALGFGSRSGNPVIFPSSLYEELSNLEDLQFGNVVYTRHNDIFRIFKATDEYELMDIDTIEDLNVLKKRIKG